MIISQFPAQVSGGATPQFTYTGQYDISVDGSGWKIKFLTSGTLIFKTDVYVDIFAVGGGGSGSDYTASFNTNNGTTISYNGAGGGGGYTSTIKSVEMTANTEYAVTVGGPGEASELLSCTAAHGENANDEEGGDGGSGGAAYTSYEVYTYSGAYYKGEKYILGGVDGADGGNSDHLLPLNGAGQGTTTREFGDANETIYANGGNSYYDSSNVTTIRPNSGDGGNGGNAPNHIGASGIVIIRNERA